MDLIRCRVANGACNIPHLVSELERLRQRLGPETVAIMQRHEAENTLEHPEYPAAITILNYRHLCRLDKWPAPLRRSVDGLNMGSYGTMQGPNEFCYTGNLKDWNREPHLGLITAPSLVLGGQQDELTPACAMRIANGLSNATLVIFKDSSHTPFYDEPELYFATLRDFIKLHQP